jgi:hypothetical protein
MSAGEAKAIANRLAMLSRRGWEEERAVLFAATLIQSSIGVVAFDIVSGTLTRLLEELDPDAITLARLVEAVKTKPAMPDRMRLEGPDYSVHPTATGPAARGLFWAKRHKVPPAKYSPSHTIRAELAVILGQLGGRMSFQCVGCAGAFTPLDVDAYVLRLMDAGRNGDPEPPRWCAKCTPISIDRGEEADDAEVPF